MNKKYFHPSLFLEILKEGGELPVRDIAKKAGCSETTVEANLKLLREEFLSIRKWKYGMWMHRALSKKEIYDKKWKAEHQEKVREANRISIRKARKLNPDKFRKRNLDWIKTNPDKHKQSCDKWRARNREHDLQKKKEWYQKNKEKAKEYMKEYYKKQKEKRKA